MTIKCAIKRSNLKGNAQTGALYPKMLSYNTIGMQKFIQMLQLNSNINTGEAWRVLTEASAQMTTLLCLGHRVKIDGLGTFSLGIKGRVLKDAHGVFQLNKAHINKVYFTPDIKMKSTLSKQSISLISHDIDNPAVLTEQQAVDRAQQMLANKSFFLAEDYAAQSGVSLSSAYRILKKLVQEKKLHKNGTRRRYIYSAPQ